MFAKVDGTTKCSLRIFFFLLVEEYKIKNVRGILGKDYVPGLSNCEFAFNLMLNVYHFASVGVLCITPVITDQAFADNVN